METVLAEAVGLCAGAINVASTWPQLWQLTQRSRAARSWPPWVNAALSFLVSWLRTDRFCAEVRGRLIQLAANLLWLAYAFWHRLTAMQLTAGVMVFCVALLAWQLHRHDKKARDRASTDEALTARQQP